MNNNKKSAMVTTELILGITLAVAVLFFAIGLFKTNLKTMVSNASLSNGFTQNESKTDYDSYNRDYTDSQINVQIMGEQGLAMLRKKANNRAIKLIENTDGNNTNVNSLAYLALVINEIVGEPHICVKMKKDSDKPCYDEEIGGYNYKITINTSTVDVDKVDDSGTVIEEKVNIDTVVIQKVNALGEPTTETKQTKRGNKYSKFHKKIFFRDGRNQEARQNRFKKLAENFGRDVPTGYVYKSKKVSENSQR